MAEEEGEYYDDGEGEYDDEGEGEGEFDDSLVGLIDRQIHELEEFINVAEDSIAYAIDEFPNPDNRDEVFDNLKGYISDLIEDFVGNIVQVEKYFSESIDEQNQRITELSRKVPLLFDKTLDFSRTLGIKAFSQVCHEQKYKGGGMVKMRAEIIDFTTESQKEFVDKSAKFLDFGSLDTVGKMLVN